MKLKILPIIIASMALVGCGSTQPSSSSSSQPSSSQSSSSSSEAQAFQFLTFLQNGKARIDIFDFEEGLQASYGNTALSSDINNVDIINNAEFTINKNLDSEKSFNTLVVAEKHTGGSDHVYKHAYVGTDGDHISEIFGFLNASLKNQGYQRIYVAFSEGTTAKWTKGLNTDMDAYLEAATTTPTDE